MPFIVEDGLMPCFGNMYFCIVFFFWLENEVCSGRIQLSLVRTGVLRRLFLDTP